MPKNKVLFVLFGLILCLFMTGCGQLTQELTGETQTTKNPPSFSEVVTKLDTPEKCLDWLQANIHYRSDQTPEDEFRAPKETFKLSYGDCDDYAVFADYVLKQHGYNSEVVMVFNDTGGHAVCVWQDADGKYNYLSNLGLREIAAEDLQKIAADVYPDWKTASVYPTNMKIARTAD